MKRYRLILAGVVLLALAVTVLVARDARSRRPTYQGHHEHRVVTIAGAYAFHFDSLPEMVATSTTVVRGTVVGVSRGLTIDEDDVTYTRRVLVIRVDRTLAGRPAGDRVTVETAGWRQVDGEPETELRVEDELPVALGTSGIFFLYDFERNGNYGFIDDQGVLLAHGVHVGHSSRTDPLVKDLETRTLAGVEALVAQADLAVRRGEVRAHRYPGRRG